MDLSLARPTCGDRFILSPLLRTKSPTKATEQNYWGRKLGNMGKMKKMGKGAGEKLFRSNTKKGSFDAD